MTPRPSSRLAHVARATMCVVVIAAAGCERPSVEQVETNAAVPVVVATAKIDTLQAVIAATGLVSVARGAELTVVAPATGRIGAIFGAVGRTASRAGRAS